MSSSEGISEFSFVCWLKEDLGIVKRMDTQYLLMRILLSVQKLHNNELKPEGPLGDHLGYYSLKHDFPYLRVHIKYMLRKDNGIWPFTVVGRPPSKKIPSLEL